MILFRRIGSAFHRIEDREWLLLSLETLGVLVGILIAFELQEWGQARNQAARHHELMERLFEETQNDISSIRSMRDVLTPMVNREQVFALALGKGECPNNAAFQALTTLGMMPALTVPSSVYQELMGAGGLSSIERKDVRDHVAQFYETLDWSQKQIDYFRTFAVSMDPVPNSDARVHVRYVPLADDPLKTTFNRTSLCSDAAFKNKVAAATRQHTVFLNYFNGALHDSISMCIRLGDSLGHQCTPAYGGRLTGDDAKHAAKVITAMKKDRKSN